LDGKEPLDATGIHPEMYDKVYIMIEAEFGVKKKAVKLPLTVSSFNIQQASTKYDI